METRISRTSTQENPQPNHAPGLRTCYESPPAQVSFRRNEASGIGTKASAA